MVWSERGKVQNYLLRDGSSCRIGEGTGEGFTWSSSIGWSGRLEATQGLLSLSTERPVLVRGLGEGEGPSSGPTVFHIQCKSFCVMGTKFYCKIACFPPDMVFYGVSGTREVGSSTVQRTAVRGSKKIGEASEGWNGR